MDCLANKMVKTRKSHHCWGCRSNIPIGSKVRYVKTADNGVILSAYWCGVCEAIIAELDDTDDFNYGDIIDNMPDEWQETYNQMYGR